MKTRKQKRLEAIERLEREPRDVPPEAIAATWERRKAEAKRLRETFGYGVPGGSGGPGGP